MFQDFNYPAILAASARGAWRVEDVIEPDARFDFTRPFLPESLARTLDAPGLAPDERLLLNQVRAHDYLSLFGVLEECILPFVIDHASPAVEGGAERTSALLNFAYEEAKHIELFKRFHAAFTRDFGHDCAVIGPAAEFADEVLSHEPLSVALIILHVEWMTQSHYLGSVRDDNALEPLFVSLLRHHWIEEAQHAKLDTLMVRELAGSLEPDEVMAAIGGYFDIVNYLDAGLRRQSELNAASLQQALGRTLPPEQRQRLKAQQHQALRWTYLGSGMRHDRFRETLGAISPAGLTAVDAVAPIYC